MSPQELLKAHGIKLTVNGPGQYWATCPQCSAKRSKGNQDAKVLGIRVEPDKVMWHCCHCDWSGPPKGSGGNKVELTSYIYRDVDGVPRFRKVRNLPGRQTRFWLEQPDGRGGWKKGVRGVDTSILYRIDEVREAIAAGLDICLVEGEKDADSCWRFGIPATCSAHGAVELGKRPKWTQKHSDQVAGASIVVFNDNDEPGYAHADATCKLSLGIAKRVRRLDLKLHWYDIGKGDDVSDWLAAGGEQTPERLRELIEAAPDYTQEPESEPSPAPEPEPAQPDDDAELERLARLSVVEYEHQRKKAAGALSVRAAMLDQTFEEKFETARKQVARGKKSVVERRTERNHDRTSVQVLPSPSIPMAVARMFVAERCTCGSLPTLRHWRGGWWQWRSSHWVELDDRAVRSLLYAFTEHAIYLTDDKKKKAWSPTRRKIGDLFEALAAICILSDDVHQPCWLDNRTTGTIVAVANGLLDVEERTLIPHTPQFFNQTSVPFDYDADAPPPTRWLQFLKMLWPSEPEAINALAEWFGYVVSGRTDLHKILLMVGPTRGGKGVVARVLSALIGRANVAGPTLNSLGGEFGLAPLIGKSLAIVSDARFAGRDASIVVERLLSISGEDTLTVNRKYRDQWTGKLPSRLHVISNELPKLGDASAAIIGRMIVLLLTNSWLGREDCMIEPTVVSSELPGVLNWALNGLQRLIGNGHRFTHVPNADDAIVQLADLASPVSAFVREHCIVDTNESIAVDALYGAYKPWAENNGYHKMTKQTFGRDLRAAVPRIRIERPRDGDERVRVYVGIGLRSGL